jgi:hypothetical protein
LHRKLSSFHEDFASLAFYSIFDGHREQQECERIQEEISKQQAAISKLHDSDQHEINHGHRAPRAPKKVFLSDGKGKDGNCTIATDEL